MLYSRIFKIFFLVFPSKIQFPSLLFIIFTLRASSSCAASNVPWQGGCCPALPQAKWAPRAGTRISGGLDRLLAVAWCEYHN